MSDRPHPLGLRRGRGKRVISRLSLHERVAEELRAMIVSGELPAGEKIKVGELSKRLDVSITPLREAIKVLASEQLVELTPNRGARVAPLDVEETRQLFEVIAGIEAMAAELVASRIGSDQIELLEKHHAQMRRCHDADDAEGYFDLNREIHDLIVDLAENPILVQVRSGLALRAERARHLSVASEAHRDDAIREHEELMQALRAHDPEAARATWHRHLIRSGEQICRVLEQGGSA